MRLPALLGLVLICSGCGTPQVSIGADSQTWANPSPWYRAGPGGWAEPYGRSPFERPAIVCDQFGRCWEAEPVDRRYARHYPQERYGRPPRWAERLPDSARADSRFLRPDTNLVCDRATRICYKRGAIDKSDTERVFGARAADRADSLRDRYGEARIFVPKRGVTCDRERRTCLDDGDPDRRLTRQYFGREAARDLEQERPRNGSKQGKRKKR